MPAHIIPTFRYHDAPAAIEFLCRAFGFEKHAVYEGEGGTVAHAQLVQALDRAELLEIEFTSKEEHKEHELLDHRAVVLVGSRCLSYGML